jgi:excisionase family DNA binding protein
MRTGLPLLISLAEAAYQLSLPAEDVAALVRDGELVAVKVRGQVLVLYDSLTAFTRRVRRQSAVRDLARAG